MVWIRYSFLVPLEDFTHVSLGLICCLPPIILVCFCIAFISRQFSILIPWRTEILVYKYIHRHGCYSSIKKTNNWLIHPFCQTQFLLNIVECTPLPYAFVIFQVRVFLEKHGDLTQWSSSQAPVFTPSPPQREASINRWTGLLICSWCLLIRLRLCMHVHVEWLCPSLTWLVVGDV